MFTPDVIDAHKVQLDRVITRLIESGLTTALQLGVLTRKKKDVQTLERAEDLIGEALSYNVASPNSSDQDEFFDGWLPLMMNQKRTFSFSMAELMIVRNAARVIACTNEIEKNMLRQYRNFVIGDSLLTYVVPYEDELDPTKLAKLGKDATAKRLGNNWRNFLYKNNYPERLNDWINKVHVDGEYFQRLFKQGKDVPLIRTIDPYYVNDGDADNMGIISRDGDFEDIRAYMVNPVDAKGKLDKPKRVSADEIIHDKRNVSFDARRGIPSGWPTFPNARRLEKLLINTSILSSIHSAIAFVRTYDGASQAKVQALLAKGNDGVSRTNTISGKDVNARAVAPGTILNASSGMKYEFPAHNVDPSKWLPIMNQELQHIAAGRNLPVDWIMGKEPTEPLTPGSPVIANFKCERKLIYEKVVRLFWMVQDFMGEKIEALQEKYEVILAGPRLAVGKSLDEARVDDLNLKNGATSPQSIAAKNGERYEIVRSQTIQHRNTAQPGEVMPGDSGNANPQGSGAGDNGGDGHTKKGGKGQRSGDAGGGNNNV